MVAAQLITISNTELTRFSLAVLLLLSSSLLFGYVFQRLNVPRVAGEIFGGLILGPSLLGNLSPASYEWIFNAFPAEGKLISAFSWAGLVLLMFIAGFEVRKSMEKDDKRIIGVILSGATLIPFLAGLALPEFIDFTPFMGKSGNDTSLRIIIAIAMSVTSIPVIAKIFIDLNVIDSRFAGIVLTIATVEDVLLWIALALATGAAGAEHTSLGAVFATTMITILFFGTSLLVIPKMLRYGNQSRYNLLIRSSATGYTLSICLLFIVLAGFLNVNIVFGAFLSGIIIGSLPSERFQGIRKNLREFSLGFFVPVYFAVVGLKLDLVHHFDPFFLLLFLSVSSTLKVMGTMISTRLVIRDLLTGLNFGAAMNARGGPGIVLATVAYDMGIINEGLFVVLVLTAIITSILSGCWFRFVLSRGWPLMR